MYKDVRHLTPVLLEKKQILITEKLHTTEIVVIFAKRKPTTDALLRIQKQLSYGNKRT